MSRPAPASKVAKQPNSLGERVVGYVSLKERRTTPLRADNRCELTTSKTLNWIRRRAHRYAGWDRILLLRDDLFLSTGHPSMQRQI